jgi:hypothetical protein
MPFLPSQRLQIITTLFSGSKVMLPKSHASIHHPQPSHLFSFRMMTPSFSDCIKAFRGQAATQGASSQSLQVRAMLNVGFKRKSLILDRKGLKPLFLVFSNEQANSHIPQPMHRSVLTSTYLFVFNTNTLNYFIRLILNSSSFFFVGIPFLFQPRAS